MIKNQESTQQNINNLEKKHEKYTKEEFNTT